MQLHGTPRIARFKPYKALTNAATTTTTKTTALHVGDRILGSGISGAKTLSQAPENSPRGDTTPQFSSPMTQKDPERLRTTQNDSEYPLPTTLLPTEPPCLSGVSQRGSTMPPTTQYTPNQRPRRCTQRVPTTTGAERLHSARAQADCAPSTGYRRGPSP